MTHPKRKRSRTVAVGILGAASFALAGCRDEQVTAQAFPDLQSCRDASIASAEMSASDCDAAFAQAQELHVQSAPRYDSRELCEEEHGEGSCGTEAQAAGGGSGSIFMPLMMGYLLGNMMSGRSGFAASQPLYRNGQGGFTNASGSSTFSTNAGRGNMSSSQFRTPPTTVGKAPLTPATVSSRGGFGGSGGSRMFGG